jgi:transposase
MSMRQHSEERQTDLWIPASVVAKSPGHPFYRRLNRILRQRGFDRHVEGLCAKFYAEKMGRPGIAPGVYFRMLLVGYFEGLDSERGIAWRCADSLGLREFLGFTLAESTPDHSSLSIIRRRLDLATHQEVFRWVLTTLGEAGLLKGRTIGVDATTLEANAALRSIVRRDTGESYTEFLTKLAKASGIEEPQREDLAKIDKKRPKKGSNEEWEHPHDPDARITKMKDGRTHLAHKAEHAVDMESGAVVAVVLHKADAGDTQTLTPTLVQAEANLRGQPGVVQPLRELVADKGYHSNDTVSGLHEACVRSYISEPARGRRNWKGKACERDATYANRRRIRGERGKWLLRRRGELLERPFAHCYNTGGMRRTHLRGHENILKRLLVHVAGCNLGLLMRRIYRFGTPKGFFERLSSLLQALRGHVHALWDCCQSCGAAGDGLFTAGRSGPVAAAAWPETEFFNGLLGGPCAGWPRSARRPLRTAA